MMFTPLFDTSRELYAWLDAQKLGSYSASIYQTRTRRKWRAKYAPLDYGPVFSRDAIVMVTGMVG